MRSSGGDDERGVDARRVFGDFGDQRVGEDVLGDGDGDGAAEGVEEDGYGVCCMLVSHSPLLWEEGISER